MKNRLQHYLSYLGLLIAFIVSGFSGSGEVFGAMVSATEGEKDRGTVSEHVVNGDANYLEDFVTVLGSTPTKPAADLDPKTAARIAKGTELSDGFISVFKNDWGIPSPQLTQLKSDLASAGDDLMNFFADKGKNGLKAWEKVRKAIGNTTNGGFTKFATDIPTLESVSKMIADGSSFRNKVGSNWEQVLDDIISKAKDGPCSSCGGTGRVGRTEMGAYLDDVDHFIKNFEITSGSKGETFYNWMRGTTNPNPGQLDELHQTLSDFAKRNIKEADVVGIGKQFPNGTKKYDLRRIGDKYTEYKNKDFVSSPLSANGSDVD